MWHIHPTEKWIDEVVRMMNEKQLKPENSRFMIAFFSSLDNDFVGYFKENKERISSFSGRNFHIFTPLIYEGNTIPDDEWRYMRNEFKSLGIPIQTDPTFIFFSLEGYENSRHHGYYYPEFFAGFSCKSFNDFPSKLKNAIDTCVDTEDTHYLSQKLSEIFLSENIIWRSEINQQFKDTIARKLPTSTVFISHSNIDKPFVRKLVAELSKDKSIKVWIDEQELLVGDNVQQTITNTLSESDFLLLVISENSTKSLWVQFEVTQFMGFAEGKNIIPVLISKENSFPKPIDSLITQLKYLDFTDETKWQSNIQELKQAIKEKSRQR